MNPIDTDIPDGFVPTPDGSRFLMEELIVAVANLAQLFDELSLVVTAAKLRAVHEFAIAEFTNQSQAWPTPSQS